MKLVELIGLVFFTICSSTEAKIYELTDDNFGEYAKQREFLLVDFFAPWCSDSKALSPELEKAAYTLGKRRNDVVKVDCFGKGKKLCEVYGIKHWPTLKTFKHGSLIAEYQGSHHAEALLNYINGAEDMIQQDTGSNYNNNLLFSQPQQDTTNFPSNKTSTTNTAQFTSPASSASAPTYEKPVAVVSSYSNQAAHSGSTATSSGTAPASITPDTSVTVTPEDVVTIGPQGNINLGAADKQASEKTTAAAAAVAALPVSITPSADVINELECAKCRIMTPVQRSQSSTCRDYRNCIPRHAQPINPLLYNYNKQQQQYLDKKKKRNFSVKSRR